MKIENPEGFESNSFGELDSRQASISEESKSFLFEMMSKNIYSNPIGSIVREITSNCFDAHKEANVDDAVVISKGYDSEGTYISFKDVGVGLSPDRIKNVYMNYFSSSKRASNDFIGGFGLGSKTPLSYANYFYIITNYNGKNYNYVLSMGKDNIPTLDLLEEKETTERNGTEIKIHIKDWEKEIDSSSHYESRFREELKAQLCYFDNVVFDNWGINNNYRLYETETFKFRNKDQYSEEMHIVLGKVCYPINWKELGIKEGYQIAIGVKFQIGELQVTPNREAIRYTDQAKALIKARVEAAYQECVTLYKDQNPPVDNYFIWNSMKNIRPHITFHYTEKLGFIDGSERERLHEDTLYLNYVTDVDKRHRLSFAEGLPFIEDDHLLSYMYSRICTIENHAVWKPTESGRRRRRSGYVHIENYLTVNSHGVYITEYPTLNELEAYAIKNGNVFRELPITHIFDKKRLRNLCIKTSEERVAILEKKLKKQMKEIPLDRDRDTLDLQRMDRRESQFGNTYTYFELGYAQKLSAAIKILRQQVRERWSSLPELTPEIRAEFKKWKEERNSATRRRKEGKVFCKNPIDGRTWEWKVANIKSKQLPYGSYKHKIARMKKGGRKWKLEDAGIESYKGIVIYGFRDDTSKLAKAYTFLLHFPQFRRADRHSRLRTEAVKVIQISQQAERFFKGRPNMIHVNHLYSDNKLFRQMASCLKIEDYLANTVRDMKYNIDHYIEEINTISEDIGGHFKVLHKYWKDRHNKDLSGHELSRRDLKQEVLKIATEQNLFDPVIEDHFRQIDEWFKDIQWVKYMELNTETIPIILKELREKKKKLNLDYYQKVVIEDKYTVKGVDKKQLSLELVIQEESDKPKFKILTSKTAA